MIDSISYRGPDRSSTLVVGDTGFAHARLSIIDLSSSADQPMVSADGRLTIVFNGEIYNFRDLRRELERNHGVRFRTEGDTEVILEMFARLGTKTFERLNGMFVLAIHDRVTGDLVLARDRMGKKPLFVAETPSGFVFGSELKAVRAHTGVTSRLDLRAVDQYLTFEYVPTPSSIIAGIRKVSPGHVLTVREGRVVRDEAWWTIDLRVRHRAFDEAVAELDSALAAATARRLVADVPLGVFLSGGIDSSSVAWFAQQASSRPISTFSIGFDDPSFDESDHAALVASRLGTEHHSLVLSERDCLELIPEIYQLSDEPLADASLIPTYLLSRFAREHVTVALGGDGSDELLAGYPTFVADRVRGLVGRVPRRGLAAATALARRIPTSDRNLALDVKVQQFLQGFELDQRHVNTLWLGSFTPAEKHRLFTADVRAELAGLSGLEPIDNLIDSSPWGGSGHAEVTYGYLRTYLLDDILAKVDRASMYHSLEVRAPFLDVDVVELCNSLPVPYKRRGLVGKRILKETMRGRLPDEILDRRKKGYGIPLSAWLRSELRPLCEELLSPAAIRQTGLFAESEVRRYLDEHIDGRANHRKKLWTLLVFQMWSQHHHAQV